MKLTGNIPSTKHVGFRNIFDKRNEIGLRKAYNADNKLYVDGDTMFLLAQVTNKIGMIILLKYPFMVMFEKEKDIQML